MIDAGDSEARSVNPTLELMPELGWPKMTMDLHVTRKNVLSKTTTGDTVTFTIKLGREKTPDRTAHHVDDKASQSTQTIAR